MPEPGLRPLALTHGPRPVTTTRHCAGTNADRLGAAMSIASDVEGLRLVLATAIADPPRLPGGGPAAGAGCGGGHEEPRIAPRVCLTLRKLVGATGFEPATS